MTTADLVHASRVPDSLAPQRFGLWEIRRFDVPTACLAEAIERFLQVGYSSYTALLRPTAATLMTDLQAEVVMEDSVRELRRHLPILLHGRGRILISGLGLGCVVRGLLAKPDVTHIDVVELDPLILSIVGGVFRDNPRVSLHEGDALTFRWPKSTRWDYAWHDVWCEDDSLAVLHMKLIARFWNMIPHGNQGAWSLPRPVKRVARRLLDAPTKGRLLT